MRYILIFLLVMIWCSSTHAEEDCRKRSVFYGEISVGTDNPQPAIFVNADCKSDPKNVAITGAGLSFYGLSNEIKKVPTNGVASFEMNMTSEYFNLPARCSVSMYNKFINMRCNMFSFSGVRTE